MLSNTLSTVQLQHGLPARHGAAAADHELPRPKLPRRDLPGGGQPQLGGPGITYRAGVSLTDGCANAQWAAELDTVSRALAAARPDLGLFVVNCPLHVAVVEQNSYVEMKVGKLASLLQLASVGGKSYKSLSSLSVCLVQVSAVDGAGGEAVSLQQVLANFVRGARPIQALDDPAVQNQDCVA